MKSKVSIIVPAYKRKYFEAALNSLLSQNYENYEVVVLDDDSPEDLKTIVDSFSSNKVSYYKNEQNIGRNDLVANWNKLLSFSSGDLIVLASDDDIYHPDYISNLVILSEKYPDIDLFHCRVGVINEDDKPIHWGASIAEFETDIDFIYQRAINRRTQLISDFMFRKKALERIGGFFNYPKAWYADEMTVYQIAKGKGVVCSQETLFFWRSSEQNISSLCNDTLQKAEASVLHLENMEKFITELKPHSDKDRFLLTSLERNISKAIKRQLIYDMAKSSIMLVFKILKQYPGLFTKKDIINLCIEKIKATHK